MFHFRGQLWIYEESNHFLGLTLVTQWPLVMHFTKFRLHTATSGLDQATFNLQPILWHESCGLDNPSLPTPQQGVWEQTFGGKDAKWLEMNHDRISFKGPRWLLKFLAAFTAPSSRNFSGSFALRTLNPYYHMARTTPRALSLQNYWENPRMRAVRISAGRAEKSRTALLLVLLRAMQFRLFCRF